MVPGREVIDGVIIVVNRNPCALGIHFLNVDRKASENEPKMMLSKLTRGGSIQPVDLERARAVN